MRDILFRGKSIDEFESLGEWVYGGIVHQTDWYGDKSDYWFIIDGTRTDYDLGYAINVDKNTICQYTGLCDKNGNKIFEGDIISLGNKTAFIVKFQDDFTRFIIEDLKNNDPEQLFSIGLYKTFAKESEIVGNMWDNPELLGEK